MWRCTSASTNLGKKYPLNNLGEVSTNVSTKLRVVATKVCIVRTLGALIACI
jgi:maleate cis-trans isomerase